MVATKCSLGDDAACVVIIIVITAGFVCTVPTTKHTPISTRSINTTKGPNSIRIGGLTLVDAHDSIKSDCTAARWRHGGDGRQRVGATGGGQSMLFGDMRWEAYRHSRLTSRRCVHTDSQVLNMQAKGPALERTHHHQSPTWCNTRESTSIQSGNGRSRRTQWRAAYEAHAPVVVATAGRTLLNNLASHGGPSAH